MDHREHELPAVEYFDGSGAWYYNDRFHRTTGPARTFMSDNDYAGEYWIHGRIMTYEEWKQICTH